MAQTKTWKRHNGHQCTTALFHLVTQKAKMHGNDTTVFNTQRHCSMLEVRLHANIPWSPPASTRNVDCWPPHHWQKSWKVCCNTSIVPTLHTQTQLTHTPASRLKMRLRHKRNLFRLAASRTKATQLLQPEIRRTKLAASKTKATLQPRFHIRASLLE